VTAAMLSVNANSIIVL